MFDTSEFYRYCDQHDVDVIPFDRLPADAATVFYKGYYGVGVNFQRIRGVRHLQTAFMHELGHLHTGALHKVSSPFQLIQQNEYRADADSFKRYLPPDEIRAAMQAGYTEPWQLAEYFNLEESYIKKALHYWTQCRGIDFNQ